MRLRALALTMVLSMGLLSALVLEPRRAAHAATDDVVRAARYWPPDEAELPQSVRGVKRAEVAHLPPRPDTVSAWAVEYVPESEIDLATLVAMLAHDQIWGNASRATRLLAWREEVIPLLEDALTSADYQQRQLAAYCLLTQQQDVLSDELLRVLVEGLARDNDASARHSDYGSVGHYVEYLIDHVEAASPLLLDALFSGDRQARTFAAFTLAYHPNPPHAEVCFDELAPHLADDSIRGNATLARVGLVRLTKHTPTSLSMWYSRTDAQGRQLLEEIELGQSEPRNRSNIRELVGILDDQIR